MTPYAWARPGGQLRSNVMKHFHVFTIFAVALMLSIAPAFAKGDLATRAKKLEPLLLGSAESDYAMSVKEYELESGKAYRLKITSVGYKGYALVAPAFFRNIWIRKIEAGDMEIKASVIDELEFEDPGGECELYFVPIRTGTYEFRIKGLEQKGMVGKFIVK